MSDSADSREAIHGERMIEIKVRFWTNDLAQGKGQIIPKHAWSSGVIRIDANKSHGIIPSEPIPFQSLMDIGHAMEKCLLEHGIQLHPSKRARKYTPESD